MRFSEFGLLTEMLLGEVNMSPKALKQMASSIPARAGMEFEMIVPNVASDDDDDELERDYEPDERASSFDQIEDFFNDGDYNSRRDVQRLIEDLQSDYSEWFMEQMDEEWNQEKEDLFRGYFEGEMTEEMAEDAGFDSVEEAIDFMIEQAIENQNSHYEQVYEEFREDYESNYWVDYQATWLRENYRFMSDVERGYDITWPYWTSPNQGGEVDVSTVADEFESVIGRPVTHGSYHSGSRTQTDNYRVEGDSSLNPYDSADAGLEFISPPLTIAEMFSDLEKVITWAKSKGCYTGGSSGTGLHMNISIEGRDSKDLDYVKLALFLGDEYVLKEFGREANYYCESAMKIIKKVIINQPDRAKSALEEMRTNLGYRASAIIHNRATSKYTSINVKDGYVEFRSPGGDWLNADINKLKDTMLRFVVALDIATDPDKYKNEYGKKLYNAIKPTEFQYYDPKDPANLKQPTKFVDKPGKGLVQVAKVDSLHTKDYMSLLDLFSKMSSGEVSENYFRNAINVVRNNWMIDKGKNPRKQNGINLFWIVTDATGRHSIELVADSKEDALAKAADEWGVQPHHPMMQGATVKLRPEAVDLPPPRPDEVSALPAGNTRFRVFQVDTPNQTEGTFIARTGDEAGIRQQFMRRLADWGFDSTPEDFGYEPV